ncbi:MAG: hypothetical protein NTY23_08210, partial [Chloroflexi bacterium]|nr:hypothetical protein [Chloroflexota bacterium]
MKRRMAVASVLAILLVTLFTAAALATEAKIYLASDMNGQNPVTNIKEGDQVYIVVDDPDNNIDCDVRDKIWVDLKIFDPKTGAYIVWDNGGYTGRDGNKAKDYLEETGPDTGLFVSKRPFQVGTRESYDGRSGYIVQRLNTHIVGPYNGVWGTAVTPTDFRWGHYEYAGQNSWGGTTNVAGDQRGWYEPRGAGASPYLTFDFNEG